MGQSDIYHFCPHSIAQDLVTKSYLIARKAGGHGPILYLGGDRNVF